MLQKYDVMFICGWKVFISGQRGAHCSTCSNWPAFKSQPDIIDASFSSVSGGEDGKAWSEREKEAETRSAQWHRHGWEAGNWGRAIGYLLQLLFQRYYSCFSHVTPRVCALYTGHAAFGIKRGAFLHPQHFCKRSSGGVSLPLSCTPIFSLSHWSFYNSALWNLIYKVEIWCIGTSDNRGNHDSWNISAPNLFPHIASAVIQKDRF